LVVYRDRVYVQPVASQAAQVELVSPSPLLARVVVVVEQLQAAEAVLV
jgi:hypothetical protein